VSFLKLVKVSWHYSHEKAEFWRYRLDRDGHLCMQSKKVETFLGEGDSVVVKVTTIDEEKAYVVGRATAAAGDR